MFEQPHWPVILIALLTGLGVLGFCWWTLTRRNRGSGRALLALALDHMTQGVIMFDSAERLVVCNRRFFEMYGLSHDIIKPGCTLDDVIRARAATGNLDADPQTKEPQRLDLESRELEQAPEREDDEQPGEHHDRDDQEHATTVAIATRPLMDSRSW